MGSPFTKEQAVMKKYAQIETKTNQETEDLIKIERNTEIGREAEVLVKNEQKPKQSKIEGRTFKGVNSPKEERAQKKSTFLYSDPTKSL